MRKAPKGSRGVILPTSAHPPPQLAEPDTEFRAVEFRLWVGSSGVQRLEVERFHNIPNTNPFNTGLGRPMRISKTHEWTCAVPD